MSSVSFIILTLYANKTVYISSFQILQSNELEHINIPDQAVNNLSINNLLAMRNHAFSQNLQITLAVITGLPSCSQKKVSQEQRQLETSLRLQN
mmetsp:Transcript_20720/g.30322  ORF Transcript_20720/g.30322 Transcript_20720/m.30322 type:complete len:94 (-) Transcript_20720:604-885(-)